MTDSIIERLSLVSEYFELAGKFQPMEGFLFPYEGYALLLYAAEGPGIGEIVEIGSYLGKSTCWLAWGSKSKAREKVTAVDHFLGAPGLPESKVLTEEGSLFPQFTRNLKQMALDDYVVPIVASSADAAKDWQRPIRLLFIDGNHSYEHCSEDLALWSPFVIPGGIIAIHDADGSYPGVIRAYQEWMAGSPCYREQVTVTSLKVIQKT